MTPTELYIQSQEVMRHCNPEGVGPENAAAFIQALQFRLKEIGGWLPPVYGTVGYADAQVIDQLRQLKFQSEAVIRNFPLGVEALSASLYQFCLYLTNHYNISLD